MKKVFYFTMIIIFILSLIAIMGCDRLQMTETEKIEALDTSEKGMLAKESGPWDCYAYAMWRATDDNKYYEKKWEHINDSEFTDGTISSSCIAEWNSHAGYIVGITQYQGKIYVEVDEWYTTHIEYGNVYRIDLPHPLGGAWKRWVKKKPDPPPPPPPDPVWVIITGPTYLDWDEEGEFVANAYDGYTPYSNYQWWWRLPEDKSGNKEKGIKGPPPGEWQELEGFEGEKTIEWGYEESFELKVRVYDAENNTDEDTHSVTVFEK